MAVNRNKRNKYTQTNNSDIFGVVLLIISAIFLICLVFPFVFSFVSVGIRYILLGLLGLFSYILFGGMFAIGLCLTLRKSFHGNGKIILLAIINVLVILLLLQFVSTYTFINTEFNSYLSEVFTYQYSAGGILFGSLAYWVNMLFSTTFSFVILSLVICIITGFIAYEIFKKYFQKQTKREYVESVEDKVETSQEPEFKQVNMGESKISDYFFNISPSNNAKTSTNTYKKEENLYSAYNINNEIIKKAPATFIKEESISADEEIIEQDNRPKKVLHTPVRKIILPTPKPKENYVEGDIIKLETPEIIEDIEVVEEIIEADDYTPVNSTDEPVIEVKKVEPVRNIDPIVTLQSYKDKLAREEALKKAPEINEQATEKTDDSVANVETVKEDKFINPNPIINSKTILNEQVEQSYFTEETEVVNNTPDDDIEIINQENIIDYTDTYTTTDTLQDDYNDEEVEEIITDNLDEEVENLSEHHLDNTDGYNGYYEKEKTTPIFSTPIIKDSKREVSNRHNIDSTNNDVQKDETKNSEKEIVKSYHKYTYVKPPIDLLNNVQSSSFIDTELIEKNKLLIKNTLESKKYQVEVANVIKGPTVTRYELQVPPEASVKKIESYSTDLSYALAAKFDVRIEAPIPGKQAIGIEVPNEPREVVSFKEMLESDAFSSTNIGMPLALGKDLGGKCVINNLEKMTHVLIAGATNTGKSVCLNSVILSLLCHCSPEDLRMLLIDPKCVEFSAYKNLPHLLVPTPITDVQSTVHALDWTIDEMNNRFSIISSRSVRNISEYNQLEDVIDGTTQKMPYIVFIVDELGDLMNSTRKKEIEEKIRGLTQKSRAAGIHLILATQRPSIDVITGTIKANLPSRLSFKVTSNTDSRVVLDQGGAEKLIGMGDMLYMPSDAPTLKRLQGPLVTNDEISSIVEFIIEKNKAIIDKELENKILGIQEKAVEDDVISVKNTEKANKDNKYDHLYPRIMNAFITANSASTSLIIRRFSVSYMTASKIIDKLQLNGWISKLDTKNNRDLLMTREQFEEVFGEPFNEYDE